MAFKEGMREFQNQELSNTKSINPSKRNKDNQSFDLRLGNTQKESSSAMMQTMSGLNINQEAGNIECVNLED